MGKTGAQNVMSGVLPTLVNITNSYGKQQINPELLELANVVTHHILEEHELDEEDIADNLEYCPVLTSALHSRRSLQSLLLRGTSWGFSMTTTWASTHLPPAYSRDSRWRAGAGM